MTEKQSLTGQIRQAVLSSGQTLTAIAAGTGIDKARLSRFSRGERGLSLQALDILAAYLGLRLMAEKKNQRKRRK